MQVQEHVCPCDAKLIEDIRVLHGKVPCPAPEPQKDEGGYMSPDLVASVAMLL